MEMSINFTFVKDIGSRNESVDVIVRIRSDAISIFCGTTASGGSFIDKCIVNF